MPKRAKFSFAVTNVSLNHFGQDIDTRDILNGVEVELRRRTGLPQIRADYNHSAFASESVLLHYDRIEGYRVVLSVLAFFGGGGAVEIVDQAVAEINEHRKVHGVRPAPPGIPGTTSRMDHEINFATRENTYHGIGHNSGCLVVFYARKGSHDGEMLLHIPPHGIAHYSFSRYKDYQDILKDAAEHCSAFLDLSFLGKEDLGEETLRVFLREHKLHGFGS